MQAFKGDAAALRHSKIELRKAVLANQAESHPDKLSACIVAQEMLACDDVARRGWCAQAP